MARSRRQQPRSDPLRLVITGPVVFMWTISGLVSLYTGDVRVFMATTTLMGAIIGVVLGVGITRKNGVY